AAIPCRDANKNIVVIRLGVFNENIEISVVNEDTGIINFKLALMFSTTAVFFKKLRIWKSLLRILVQHLHVAVTRRTVQVIVKLFAIFSVITFRSGQTKEALFDNRILFIPESRSKT